MHLILAKNPRCPPQAKILTNCCSIIHFSFAKSRYLKAFESKNPENFPASGRFWENPPLVVRGTLNKGGGFSIRGGVSP